MLTERLRKAISEKVENLQVKLSNPSVLSNRREIVQFSKELDRLSKILSLDEKLDGIGSKIAELEEMRKVEEDEEMKNMILEEIETLKNERKRVESELVELLAPKDENDEKNVIMEIRSAVGGEESALFAGDLLRMYLRYAERKGWKADLLHMNRTDLGGVKECILRFEGKGVYRRLKYESGVHRVQRIPITESGGRIHTSTATVVVLPEASELEVELKMEELRIETFRASGHGGQYVNKTESAVRITHIPTGIVVTCQSERSQHQNKKIALDILRARLLRLRTLEHKKAQDSVRRSSIGSGERSEKIRTYNFPQNRVSDHRIGLTLYILEDVLDGNLDPLIEPLMKHEIEESFGRWEVEDRANER